MGKRGGSLKKKRVLRGPTAQCRGVGCAKNSEYNDNELESRHQVTPCTPSPSYPPYHAPSSLALLAGDLHLCTFLARFARSRMDKRRWRTVFGEGHLWPTSQILALHVYNMPTVSTISRLCPLGAHCVYRLFTAFSCARVNDPPPASG